MYVAGVPPEVPAATVAVTLAVPATTVGAGGVPGADTVDDAAEAVTFSHEGLAEKFLLS